MAARRSKQRPAEKRRVAKATARAKPAKRATPTPSAQLDATLAWLERKGTKKTRDSMVRYAIHADKAYGVTMADMRALGKRLGTNHELATALWKTGWYEARMVTAFVADPERLSSAEMDRLCRDFDNWAICDTLCFSLFDRSPLAFDKVEQWAARREEFVKRAAFALLATLALHGRGDGDAPFLRALPLVERAASDERNFVKKGVSWALRAIGVRSLELNTAAMKLAQRLATSPNPAARWIGKDALRDLARPIVARRLAKKHKKSAAS
jgi:3-methyladenine DNA glycosylase AlkD